MSMRFWSIFVNVQNKSSRREVLCKKVQLKNFAKFTRKTPVPESASACNFIKKEPLGQVFSCEFCKIFKNTLLYRTSFQLILLYLNENYRLTWLTETAWAVL